MKIKKKIKKRIFLILAGLMVFAFFALVAFSFFVIHKSVRSNCIKAKNEFGGDCIDSLIALVKSEKFKTREKNSAIWALGQLADKRALPLLYELEQSLPEQEKCHYY